MNSSEYTINEWVRKTLFIGMGISLALFSVGALLGYLSLYPVYSRVLMDLGAGALLLTPIFRLFATSYLMIKEKDYKYGVLGLVLVALIAFGLLVGRFKI